MPTNNLTLYTDRNPNKILGLREDGNVITILKKSLFTHSSVFSKLTTFNNTVKYNGNAYFNLNSYFNNKVYIENELLRITSNEVTINSTNFTIMGSANNFTINSDLTINSNNVNFTKDISISGENNILQRLLDLETKFADLSNNVSDISNTLSSHLH